MGSFARFAEPPIVEVACGTLFSPPQGFKLPHIGRFWNLIQEGYPNVDEVPPMIDEGLAQKGLVDFGPFPLPRTWFTSRDGTSLIQLQRDRFVYNWKRASKSSEYPHYDVVIEEFDKYFQLFRDFLLHEFSADLVIRQLELTYVNIVPEAALEPDGNLLIDHRTDQSLARFLPRPLGFSWQTTYPLPRSTGELVITAQKLRLITDGSEVIRLDLSAKGISPAAAESGALRDWFDTAHETIVKGFVDVTDAKMQTDKWGRKE